MKKVQSILSKTNYCLAMISGYAIFVMMLIAVIDVVGRFIFNAPLKGSTDLIELTMVVGVFLGMSYVQEHDSNAKVDILYMHFKGKLRSVVNAFNSLISLFICGLLSWRLMVRAMNVISNNNLMTATLRIPIGPFLLIAAIGCAVLCLQLLLSTILNVLSLFEKEEA